MHKNNGFLAYKKVFMIGIGGVSMSGIAEILKSYDILVSGSNNVTSPITNHLKDIGIDVKIPHSKDNIENPDLVIYTAAIPKDNEELLEAHKKGIKTMERADFVGLMTKTFTNTICISGTHGKSTTSAMIASCFIKAKMDPTVQIGANLNVISGNYRVGNSSYFILEACEYVDSFLKFHPKSAIILNIDNDHLNYFKNIDNIKASFLKFANLIPNDGFLVINDDDINEEEISKTYKGKLIRYSLNNQNCDYYANNICYNDLGYPTFDVYKSQKFLFNAKLSVFGLHNISNALATIAICKEYRLNDESIISGLKEFTGVGRRFELLGKYNDEILVYDDYAHHPTEIKTTLEAIKKVKHNESWAVFQPHTYSRTKDHLKEFGDVLSNFDHIIIAKIYAARETDNLGISENDLLKVIRIKNKNAVVIPEYNDIVEYLKNNVKPKDAIITIGAGPINEVGLKLLDKKNNS